MKKIIEVQVMPNGGIFSYVDCTRTKTASAVALIEAYCENDENGFELSADIKIAAKINKNIKAAELSKIEWFSQDGFYHGCVAGDASFMIPIDGENGVEFIVDEKKTAEHKAKENAKLTIRRFVYFNSKGGNYAEELPEEVAKLAEVAKNFPSAYAEALEETKEHYARFRDERTVAFLAVLPQFESLIVKNESSEIDDGSNDDAEEEENLIATVDTGENEDDELVDEPEEIDAAETVEEVDVVIDTKFEVGKSYLCRVYSEEIVDRIKVTARYKNGADTNITVEDSRGVCNTFKIYKNEAYSRLDDVTRRYEFVSNFNYAAFSYESTDEVDNAAERQAEKRYYTNVYIGKWNVLGFGYTGTVKEFKTAMEAFKYLKNKESRYSPKTHWIHEIYIADNLEDFFRKHCKAKNEVRTCMDSPYQIYAYGTTWYRKETSKDAKIQALIDAQSETERAQ